MKAGARHVGCSGAAPPRTRHGSIAPRWEERVKARSRWGIGGRRFRQSEGARLGRRTPSATSDAVLVQRRYGSSLRKASSVAAPASRGPCMLVRRPKPLPPTASGPRGGRSVSPDRRRGWGSGTWRRRRVATRVIRLGDSRRGPVRGRRHRLSRQGPRRG